MCQSELVTLQTGRAGQRFFPHRCYCVVFEVERSAANLSGHARADLLSDTVFSQRPLCAPVCLNAIINSTSNELGDNLSAC